MFYFWNTPASDKFGAENRQFSVRQHKMDPCAKPAEKGVASATAAKVEKLCAETMERARSCKSYEELVLLLRQLPLPGTPLDVSGTIGNALWSRARDLAVAALPKVLADIVNDVGQCDPLGTTGWTNAKGYSSLGFIWMIPVTRGPKVFEALSLIAGDRSGDRARSMDEAIKTHRDAVEAVTMFLKKGHRSIIVPGVYGDPLMEQCKRRLHPIM